MESSNNLKFNWISLTGQMGNRNDGEIYFYLVTNDGRLKFNMKKDVEGRCKL